MKTLYALLGVDPDAEQSDIQIAYERLKARYPQSKLDTDEAARLQFQGIQQAYNTLYNPALRKIYDQRLAKAGVRIASGPDNGDGSSWMSTRNIIVAGLFVLVIAGMWFYHAREQARLQRELVERTLKMEEDRRKEEADIRAAQEQRIQAQVEANAQSQSEMRDRQLRADADRSLREAQMSSRQAQQQAAQQAMIERQQAAAEQSAKQRAAFEAQRRIQEDKAQLRSICLQRYGRPDC
ncbi:MAG TPA: DnaJ domain-containing protein [Burkholderiales bacterium]|jgi:DnaJ-class molecular chaperone